MTPNYNKDERHPGQWKIRWRELGPNGYINKIQRGFKSKKEAQAWFMAYTKKPQEIVEAEPEKENAMLFSELANQWLEFERNRVKGSSYATLLSRVNAQLIPVFGDYKVSEITPIMVLKWQSEMTGSFEYRKNIRHRLAAIYKYGHKYYNIPNIMDKVDGLRNLEPKKEMNIWTPEQFDVFFAACDNEQYKLFFLCLYVFGCRKGELQALTWKDVDFVNKEVHIRHTVTNKIPGEAYTITTPKNQSSDRKILIPESLCALLQAHKKQNNATSDNFCFGKTRPLPAESIRRFFQITTEKADLPPIRIHDIRHSCASMLISQGIDIVTVSKRLGHSSTKQTLDTYSHMMPKANDLAVNVFSDFITKKH